MRNPATILQLKGWQKLPYNPRIWKTLLKAHFQQFMDSV